MVTFTKCLMKLLSLIVIIKTTESFVLPKFENPKMILVSFDGFRWDYLKKFNLPHFNYLKSIGSHAEHIKNSFSTVTFPNHWTIVTGMYEETHGIVQNSMYDPILDKEFSTKDDSSQTYEWYGQNKATEPIWIANQKAGDGRKSAAEWVGAGVSFDDESAIFIPYNNTKPYRKLVNQFIELFKKDDPINFGAIYFDEPDHTGHLYGPYSKEMEKKLHYVDQTLGYLLKQLKTHDLFEETNLIITSDHGMEQISNKTAIFLDSHIDTNLFNAFGSRACYSLFVKNLTNIEYVYKTLKSVENISVLKKHEVPKHFHYKKNVRIGDIVIITKIGYGVYIENNRNFNWTINNGDHGFSNEELSMHPIFISHGPAFKKNFTIKPFNNVDIYPLMCYVLGITPGTNNGTLSNVIDMIDRSYIPNARFGFYFIMLVVIPLSVFILTVIFVFIRRKISSKNTNYEHLENTISEDPNCSNPQNTHEIY